MDELILEKLLSVKIPRFYTNTFVQIVFKLHAFCRRLRFVSIIQIDAGISPQKRAALHRSAHSFPFRVNAGRLNRCRRRRGRLSADDRLDRHERRAPSRRSPRPNRARASN
ncbi:hypothetical protein [Burkholderia pseudomallei]|uniref:hypothetical protein n=1 Tax=Burkholderia pseudomallei TaxID=28450 RepID=UPI002D21CB2F|nr:hypothetical protein [Burkholderia pseudomallei]